MKSDQDKLFKLSDNLLMSVTGESGDTSSFAEFIEKNVQLYKMRNGYQLPPTAAVNFTRHHLAEYLRSQTPYKVDLMMGGYADTEGPSLHVIDYLASKVKVPFAAHGYGGFVALSILDRFYKSDLTIEEGHNLLKSCVREIHQRLVINLPNFRVSVIDKNGIRDLETITPATVAA